MKVVVRLFAAARQAVGRDSVEIDMPDGGTVADLRRALVAMYPELAPVATRAMFAVNEDYAKDAAAIPPGATVACIPPVSGG